MPGLLRRILRPVARLYRVCALHLDLLTLRLTNRVSRESVTGSDGPVVSLATYGKRLATAYLTIESIARGSTKPKRLLLWLDDPAQKSNLPVELQRLQKRGLEVKLSDRNYGPHKKYYPYVLSRIAERRNGHDGPLVTADDDILYPRSWLAGLVRANVEAPNLIHCYRSRVLTFSESGLASYSTWPLCRSAEPSPLHFAIGVSGILYPPEFLDLLAAAGPAFEQVCPRADDIWLHANALRNGIQVRQISRNPVHFPLIPGTQQEGLQQENLHDNGNDEQARKTYTSSDLAGLRSLAQPS